MYIEYLGIPGCGKTFLKDKYLLNLSQSGQSFLDISRQKVMPLWLKVFYKFAETILLQLPKYKRLTQEYKTLCSGCLQEPKFVPFSLAYCIKDIVLATLLHDIFNGKKIYVNDEGQLQRLVFLSVQFGIDIDKLMPLYMKYRGNVKTIYVKTEVDKAFANIKRRNRHVCPMDELTDVLFKAYETEFYNCCEKIAMKINDRFEKKEI